MKHSFDTCLVVAGAIVNLRLQFTAVTKYESSNCESCGLYYKVFMIVNYDQNDSTIVIYNRNDSGQYYKTTITAQARIVNYDGKLRSKLKHNLRS